MSMKSLRNRVLKRHGLQPTEGGRLEANPVESDPSGRKTLAMMLVERAFDTKLEKLLMQGNHSEVAQKLGIAKTTVSAWRLRLGLREMKDGHDKQVN